MLPEIHSGVSRYRTERRDDREPQICRLRSFLRENLGPGGAGAKLAHLVGGLWSLEQGQDIAEYAVMLAVILVLVVATIRLIGGNANSVFSAAASSIQ